VGPIQQALGTILEPALEEAEAQGPVGHVGKAHDEAAPRGQTTPDASEEFFGSLEVLEDVPKQHDIEPFLSELAIEIL
jgi:hypothetical protein